MKFCLVSNRLDLVEAPSDRLFAYGIRVVIGGLRVERKGRHGADVKKNIKPKRARRYKAFVTKIKLFQTNLNFLICLLSNINLKKA